MGLPSSFPGGWGRGENAENAIFLHTRQRRPGFRAALFPMQKHRKLGYVPFPRPYGAAGNDAQKIPSHVKELLKNSSCFLKNSVYNQAVS